MKWDGAEEMWRVWRSMAWTGIYGRRRKSRLQNPPTGFRAAAFAESAFEEQALRGKAVGVSFGGNMPDAFLPQSGGAQCFDGLARVATRCVQMRGARSRFGTAFGSGRS